MPDTPDDDLIDGCDVDMADPAYRSTDEQVDALLMFGDLPWTGTAIGGDGREFPTCDPDAVAQRVADLQALSGAGLDGTVPIPGNYAPGYDPAVHTSDPAWFGAHGQGEALPNDDDEGTGGTDA